MKSERCILRARLARFDGPETAIQVLEDTGEAVVMPVVPESGRAVWSSRPRVGDVFVVPLLLEDVARAIFAAYREEFTRFGVVVTMALPYSASALLATNSVDLQIIVREG